MSAAWPLNTAWMISCSVEAGRFGWACRHAADAQARLLLQTVQANRHTEFGEAHSFDRIRSVRDYQERVPLALYDDFAPAVQRIADGVKNILTAEPVTLLEPTSGTTSGEKLIPYTAGLRRQFQRGVAAWIANLFWHRPALRDGRAYWSISPALGPVRRSPGGIPIGFSDDAAYLGTLEQFAVRRVLAVPGAVARISDLTAFRYATLRFLLAAGDLTLISVWNPTFLTALLRPLPEWFDRLCADIRDGSLLPPAPLDAPIAAALAPYLRPDPRRADELVSTQGSLAAIWPRLRLVSCWTDAAAGQFVPDVARLLPGVEIQPKGLLATEGFVSLPLVGEHGAALALRSHFFEFLESAGSRARLAHELEVGGRYRVVLTTAGGLYRYKLHDEIEVVGRRRQCPLLRFVGKADLASDLVGEKLAEPHVRSVVEGLALSATFALLVPVTGAPPRYRLYVQGDGIAEVEAAARLQAGLEENPYYRHAVAMGQLSPAEVCVLDPQGESAWSVFERRKLALGQKCGAIKPAALDPWPGWPAEFAPSVTARGVLK